MSEPVAPLLLPVDLVLSHEPAWLGPAVVLVGLAVFLGGYVRHYVVWPGGLVAMMTVFGVFGVLPWVASYPDLAGTVVSFVGSWFGGVGAVKGYLRSAEYVDLLGRWLRGEGDDRVHREVLDHVSRSVSRAVVLKLALVLAVLLSVWVVAFVTAYTPLSTALLSEEVVVAWTLVTLLAGVLGTAWRFRGVRDSVPASILLGVVLMIAGAEVYNLQLFGSGLAVLFVSKAVYAAGYTTAASLWVLKVASSDDRAVGAAESRRA
jgi:hypothetical protein